MATKSTPQASAELAWAQAMDAPHGYSNPGTLPHWTINLTLSGTSIHRLNSVDNSITRGAFVITRPNSPQLIRVPAAAMPTRARAVGPQAIGWSCVYAIFQPRPHWIDWLNYPQTGRGISVLQLSGESTIRKVARWMKRAAGFFLGTHPLRTGMAMAAIEQALLHVHADQLAQSSSLDPRVQRATNWVMQRLRQTISLDDMARAALASPSHLSSLFRKQLGMSPMRYVDQQRMQRATQMLTYTSHSLKEIADELGYDDTKYLMRRFKAYAGMTLRDYRQKTARSPGAEQGTKRAGTSRP